MVIMLVAQHGCTTLKAGQKTSRCVRVRRDEDVRFLRYRRARPPEHLGRGWAWDAIDTEKRCGLGWETASNVWQHLVRGLEDKDKDKSVAGS